MKQDERGKVVELTKRIIPRSVGGNDPAFKDLTSVKGQFTDEEITVMVNRYIYDREYQRGYHREKEREKREKEKPIKDKVRELFGVSWMNASEEQIEMAIQALKEEKEDAEKSKSNHSTTRG